MTDYKELARWPKYWIPVEKELPTSGKVVFVLCEDMVARYGYSMSDGSWLVIVNKVGSEYFFSKDIKVTHWSNIPVLPENNGYAKRWMID